MDRHWAAVPETARRDYGTVAAPGTPLVSGRAGGGNADGVEFNLALAREHFTVLNVEVAEMELLQLDHAQHERTHHAWNEAHTRWEAQPLVP